MAGSGYIVRLTSFIFRVFNMASPRTLPQHPGLLCDSVASMLPYKYDIRAVFKRPIEAWHLRVMRPALKSVLRRLADRHSAHRDITEESEAWVECFSGRICRVRLLCDRVYITEQLGHRGGYSAEKIWVSFPHDTQLQTPEPVDILEFIRRMDAMLAHCGVRYKGLVCALSLYRNELDVNVWPYNLLREYGA